jgi:hypothetical protein
MRTWDRQLSHMHALIFSRELRSDLIRERPPVEHRDKHVGYPGCAKASEICCELHYISAWIRYPYLNR